jgi:type VI secretion system protein ImpF
METPADKERSLRFRITGLLIAEPEAEPVTFDTYFDVNRGQYVIS